MVTLPVPRSHALPLEATSHRKLELLKFNPAGANVNDVVPVGTVAPLPYDAASAGNDADPLSDVDAAYAPAGELIIPEPVRDRAGSYTATDSKTVCPAAPSLSVTVRVTVNNTE